MNRITPAMVAKMTDAQKTILTALLAVQEIIENTYAHDDDGERDEDAEPEHSGADIVEQLCGIELLIDEAIDCAKGGAQ